MKKGKLNIVIFGLSITSSWGNGHATTYRGLVRELNKLGHSIIFFERDAYWYAENRDMPEPPFCRTILYNSLKELQKYIGLITSADLVILGSYVPEGIAVGNFILQSSEGITAFYDIDTPVTLSNLQKGKCEYLSEEQIARYNIYLSFTGGPILDTLQDVYGSPMAKAFYCSVDPQLYYPDEKRKKWDLGYLGTYSPDRQIVLEELLIKAAEKYKEGRFIVAGPQYPDTIKWPSNIKREIHLSPREHRDFYNTQRFTLNITRSDMVMAGYSPSVRLFEAAACGIPIISDYWKGLETIFELNKEILISKSYQETLYYLKELDEAEVLEISLHAKDKVLNKHTSHHRALQLLEYYENLLEMKHIDKSVH